MPSIKVPWRKILYEAQEYPDNYTDKTFLWDLKRNLDPCNVSLWSAITGASKVTVEFCTSALFVVTYIFMYNEWILHEKLFHMIIVITITGYSLYRIVYDNNQLRTKLGNDIRTLLIFIVFGQLFAPVLHTLTDTISTDTIYTMAFFMLMVHLIFFDYGSHVALVSNSFSLSAAMFASICLASRLASPHEAFILITIAIALFVLSPLIRNKFESTLPLAVILTILNFVILYHISILISLLFSLVILFLNVICPTLYIRYQSYKDNIYGPWDEAIVQDADNINDLLLKKTA